MLKQLFLKMKPFLKTVLALVLVVVLILGNASDALAARSGGRIGGGSFRAPSRSYSAPSGGSRAPVGGYGYGGGFGFPFLLPFFGFGGGFGGLFTIFLVITVANFLVRSFRNLSGDEQEGTLGYSNPQISVAQVQVGLFANARGLQKELDEIALAADTGSSAGRAMVLQETTLALLRHPEYWVYGSTLSQQAALTSAEAKFNQLALAERSKFTSETLSNVNNQLRQASTNTLPDGSGQLAQTAEGSGEYIVITLIVGAEGKLELPAVNDTEDLEKALKQIGSVGSDRLLAIEVLWTPQSSDDTLTSDDVLAAYPNLKLV
jgi:uncharacterized membrane protein